MEILRRRLPNAYAPPVRAAALCLVLAACGFSTPGGGLGPGSDAAPTGDGAIASGDSNLTGDAGPADAMLDASSCPASFAPIANSGTSSRYLAFPKNSQLLAIATCANLNTHLLRVDDQNEADALVTYLATASGSSSTGLFRVVGARDGVFRNLWHDLDFSLLSFLPWGQSEPTDTALGFEDCIVLKEESGDGVYGAHECSSLHEFACECD